MHVINLQGATSEEPNQRDDGASDLQLLVIFLSSSVSLCFPFQQSGAGGRALSSDHAFPRWLWLRRFSSALSFLLSFSIISLPFTCLGCKEAGGRTRCSQFLGKEKAVKVSN